MSYTELYRITPSGRIIGHAEFKNSHRGAMLVWCNVWKQYCKESVEKARIKIGMDPFGPISKEHYKEVWALFDRQDIPEYIRAVLGSTFDRVVLESAHFDRFYQDVLKYAASFEAGTLIEQAQVIVKLPRKRYYGVCWNQTSVSEGCWYKGDINKVDGPWSLYAQIERMKTKAQVTE